MRRAALAALCLSACNLEPRYTRPTPPVPPAWPTGPAYADQVAGLPMVRWRELFRDPKLAQVIEIALANSQDVAAAFANLELARAQYRVARAAQLPSVSAGAGVQVSRVAAGRFGAEGRQDILTIYSTDLGLAAFELDLFGRVRSLSRAAVARFLSADAAARAARLTLVAEVATAYAQLAADQTLLSVAQDTARAADEGVRLTAKRLEGGIAPRTDLAQAETIRAQARSDVERLTTLVAQDRNALDRLAGAPVPPTLLPGGIAPLAAALTAPPGGLSSEVLLRRPDVAAAEYTLRATNAQIGAARAAFFPRISLTASSGLASPALAGLFSYDAFNWTVSPQVTLPIFQGGLLRGNLAVARAQREQAVTQYRISIQTGFREVADALARRGTIDRQLAQDRAQSAAAQTTLDLVTARYREGIDPFLTTLDAQRTLYAARRLVAQSELERAANAIEVYRALGGDELTDMAELRGRAAVGR